MLTTYGADGFAAALLRARGLEWAADLLGGWPDARREDLPTTIAAEVEELP